MKRYAVVALLLSFMSQAVVTDVHTIRTLESMQTITSAAALTSFFLADMVPADYAEAVLVTSFFSQLAHIATNVALLKYKKNKSAALRTLFPIAALFSFIKISAVLYENRLQQAPEIQTDLIKMGQEVAEGDQQELVLATIFSMGLFGQFGMLCYDCLSTES